MPNSLISRLRKAKLAMLRRQAARIARRRSRSDHAPAIRERFNVLPQRYAFGGGAVAMD